MNTDVFIILIYPLLTFIISVIGTRKIGLFFVMPIATFTIFLIMGTILYDLQFFFWTGMYSVFSFIVSYITILFTKGTVSLYQQH